MLLTLSPLYSPEGFRARLACLIHAANVRSEPGSNPSIKVFSLALVSEGSTLGLAHCCPSYFARTQLLEGHSCFQRSGWARNSFPTPRCGDVIRTHRRKPVWSSLGRPRTLLLSVRSRVLLVVIRSAWAGCLCLGSGMIGDRPRRSTLRSALCQNAASPSPKALVIRKL